MNTEEEKYAKGVQFLNAKKTEERYANMVQFCDANKQKFIDTMVKRMLDDTQKLVNSAVSELLKAQKSVHAISNTFAEPVIPDTENTDSSSASMSSSDSESNDSSESAPGPTDSDMSGIPGSKPPQG